MRVATKLTLLLSGSAVGLLACAFFPMYLSERGRLLEEMENRQLADVQRFARVCADSLASRDEDGLANYLKTLLLLAEPGEISDAMLLDDAGSVLVHSAGVQGGSPRGGLPGDALRRAVESKTGARQRVPGPTGELEVLSAPLYELAGDGERRAGTALIAYHRSAIDAALRRMRGESLRRVSRLVLPAFALTVVLAVVLGRALTRPIAALEEGAREIGKGRLDVRIPAESADEVGSLAREFNAMASKLSELDQLKEGFLAQITHDLANPLSAVSTYVDLLLSGVHGPLTKDQKRSLRVVAEGAAYLDSLLGDILTLTRLDAGRFELQKTQVDFAALAGAVVDVMTAKANEYGVRLETRLYGGPAVWADEQALRRVITNLVSNALKFTPKGGQVTVMLSEAEGSDLVEVADTGVGIPPDKIGALFTKFFQVAETKNQVREARGTGLGLVICKQLVEAHGGAIGVRSDFGRGSTFHFTLPKCPDSSAACKTNV
ncbi:MAG: HAMP domain-containing histidine kinase [Elusimicrobia bacterium]|nr:HAMP domain-containing histidine kinase [Elusimicrobiota bacterium]